MTDGLVRASLPTSGIWSGSPIVAQCLDARRDRLRAMNLEQRHQPQASCAHCAALPASIVRLMTLAVDVDIAIVGSGFSGALCALALRQRGRRVALIERGRHPRFAIGESTTPLTNLLLEELADRYDLPQIRVLLEMGHVAADAARRRLRPQARIHVPLSSARGTIRRRPMRTRASCSSRRARTTRWRIRIGTVPSSISRSCEQAQAAGAIYLDETRLEKVRDNGAGMTLEGTRDGRAVEITAGFVIDASGPRGFLTTALGTGSAPLRWLPPTAGTVHAFRERRSLGRRRAR